MDFFPHQFAGKVVRHDIGSDTYAYTVVWVPGEIATNLQLEKTPRLRVVGEIGEVPFKGALHPVRGQWYILLSKKMLARIGCSHGDHVDVHFRPDRQDTVDVPAVLQTALADDDELRDLWDGQTPGKQRSLAYLVASAKTPPTQLKRIEKVRLILLGELDLRGNPI